LKILKGPDGGWCSFLFCPCSHIAARSLSAADGRRGGGAHVGAKRGVWRRDALVSDEGIERG